MPEMDTRCWWLALNLVPGMGSMQGLRLHHAFGSPENIFHASAGALSAVEGMGTELAQRIASFEPEIRVKQEQGLMGRLGVDFITFEDPSFPESLRYIYDPPLVLYIKGEITPEDKISIAMVGSRRPTIYGKYVAKDLAEKLGRRGITIVSGMARGIDTMAHKGALAAQGRTIAVMGSGLDRIYPAENKKLMEGIARQGAVISEFPLGTPPYKQNFPLRNRIISGITLGTLVVEAGPVSGALITARLALEQGREVFAVPGPINSWASKGTNGLIKQGARVVEGESDIYEELGPKLGELFYKDQIKKENGPINKKDAVTDPILEILQQGPLHIDTIIERTGIPAHEMASRLNRLEMEGIITQLPGKKYVKAL